MKEKIKLSADEKEQFNIGIERLTVIEFEDALRLIIDYRDYFERKDLEFMERCLFRKFRRIYAGMKLLQEDIDKIDRDENVECVVIQFPGNINKRKEKQE